VTLESLELSVPLSATLLMFVGGALAVVGCLIRGEPTRFNRAWAWAWSTLFLGSAFLLLTPQQPHPAVAGLLGLSPPLLLVGSLGFVGQRVPSWVTALVPTGAFLSMGLALLGPATAPIFSAFTLAVGGGAAVVLYRRARPGWIQQRLLPLAMGSFALVYAAGVVAHPDYGLTWPTSLVALSFALLIAAQSLATLERLREESEQAESERQEIESRYRSLADLSNLVVLVLDRDQRVIEWNRVAEAIYGWTREEALGQNYVETFLPEDAHPAILALIDRILAGGQARGYEKTALTRQGERTLRWNMSRLMNAEGRSSGILCLGEDVTEERRQREEQRRLLAAVEQAGDGVVVADTNGGIVYANPAFCAMIERPNDDLVDRQILETLRIEPEGPRFREIVANLAMGEISRLRYATRWLDGRSFMWDVTVAPVRNEEGTITHAVSVLRDVTREVQLEEKLARSQKLTALGTLAGGIAHDFNNLLTVVIGGAHLLIEEQAPGEVKRTAEEILEAAQRGASLSGQLLAFSRRKPLHPEVIGLDALVPEMKGLLERLIGEHIELTTACDEALWNVTAERSQIEQVIMNLVLNARDAMPEGGQLMVRAVNRTFASRDPDRPPTLEPGDYVSLSVGDTGSGMDEETRSRAFEPFFTRKPPGSGTGLGLATVFAVARQSGGDVAIVSEPGQGSRVDVHLPRTRDPVADAVARPEEARVGGDETILLVEDDFMVRSIARRTLEGLGYRVLVADNSECAWTSLQREPVDLLLTDVVMPGKSGIELAQEFFRLRPDRRVLFISGYAGRLGSEDLFAPLLEKPFTPDQLARRVREVLG
jgi:PAS domain S-box-containing protein